MTEETADVKAFLNRCYDEAMSVASGKTNIESALRKDVADMVNVIVKHAESSKGVLAVLFTSLVYKLLNPEQNIRSHQASIKGGYAGRTFDVKYITPFLKAKRFPAMRESGWLTRSLEQKSPYTLDYKGAITPAELKKAFLGLLDYIQSETADVKGVTSYLLQLLIAQRDRNAIDLAVPRNLSIEGIVMLLDKHFHGHYVASGAARLPVIALYAMYQCLFNEGIKRFAGKVLLPLESHTSADARSGRLGDIDIVDADGKPFEVVEVKFDIPVSHDIVVVAKEKIQPSKVERYYILSTRPTDNKDKEIIDNDIRQIKNIHGCQLVINGVMPTLKYYMRLLNDPITFLEKYVGQLQTDKAIKFEHKQAWNELVSTL